jgi:hypothetical protein
MRQPYNQSTSIVSSGETSPGFPGKWCSEERQPWAHAKSIPTTLGVQSFNAKAVYSGCERQHPPWQRHTLQLCRCVCMEYASRARPARCHLENSPRPEDNKDIVVWLSSLYLLSRASSSCISIQGIRDLSRTTSFIDSYHTAHLLCLSGVAEKMKVSGNFTHMTILGHQPGLRAGTYLQQSG